MEFIYLFKIKISLSNKIAYEESIEENRLTFSFFSENLMVNGVEAKKKETLKVNIFLDSFHVHI